jgi:hypothetical protein
VGKKIPDCGRRDIALKSSACKRLIRRSALFFIRSRRAVERVGGGRGAGNREHAVGGFEAEVVDRRVRRSRHENRSGDGDGQALERRFLNLRHTDGSPQATMCSRRELAT